MYLWKVMIKGKSHLLPHIFPRRHEAFSQRPQGHTAQTSPDLKLYFTHCSPPSGPLHCHTPPYWRHLVESFAVTQRSERSVVLPEDSSVREHHPLTRSTGYVKCTREDSMPWNADQISWIWYVYAFEGLKSMYFLRLHIEQFLSLLPIMQHC